MNTRLKGRKGMTKEKKACNYDCLNCKLPKCKFDEKEEPVEGNPEINEYKDREDYQRQYQKAYYQKNKERIKEHQRKYRKTHREKVNEIRRRSYQKNRETELERQRAYCLRRVFNDRG